MTSRMSTIPPMNTKTCNHCGLVLPADRFNKNNQQKDGLTGACKTCIAQNRKGYDKKYNAGAKARRSRRKYYYSARGQATKRAYRQKYTLTEEQREKYRAAARLHEKEPKYKDRQHRYRQSPKGKQHKANSDLRYRKTPNGRFAKRKIELKRKHQIAASDCTLTRKEWEQIKDRFGQRCAYCKRTAVRLEMDHVTPLSKGGAHTANNIVPACRTCNAKKGNREPLIAALYG